MNQDFMNNQEQPNEPITFGAEQKPKKKKIYKRWWFWGIVAAVVIIIISAMSGGNEEPSDLVDLPEQEYRNKCQVYAYDEIARYPDKYEKSLAKFTGEVVQVMRDGDNLQMRVDVTKNEYDFYEDTVYVYYTISNNVNVLEGDIITMYGELRGTQTYESVLGAEISIPRIYVQYIDIVE